MENRFVYMRQPGQTETTLLEKTCMGPVPAPLPKVEAKPQKTAQDSERDKIMKLKYRFYDTDNNLFPLERQRHYLK